MLEIVSGTALWNNPGHRVPIRYVLVRDPQGKLEPQAFLCTDLDADRLDILRWFVRRWSIEVTFAEVRRHLGVETQRQWSDRAPRGPEAEHAQPAPAAELHGLREYPHGPAGPCRARLERRKGRLTPRDLHALTPLLLGPVNPYGRFDHDMRTRLDLN